MGIVIGECVMSGWGVMMSEYIMRGCTAHLKHVPHRPLPVSTIPFVVFVGIAIFRNLLIQILPPKSVFLQYIRPNVLFRIFSLKRGLGRVRWMEVRLELEGIGLIDCSGCVDFGCVGWGGIVWCDGCDVVW